LNASEANALIDRLSVYRDTGNGTFDPTDTLVADVNTLSLTFGLQSVPLARELPGSLISADSHATFFVVVDLTADAAEHPVSQFLVTHVTEGSLSSMVRDRQTGVDLTSEFAANVSSSPVQIVEPPRILTVKLEVDPVDPMPGGTFSVWVLAKVDGTDLDASGGGLADTQFDVLSATTSGVVDSVELPPPAGRSTVETRWDAALSSYAKIDPARSDAGLDGDFDALSAAFADLTATRFDIGTDRFQLLQTQTWVRNTNDAFDLALGGALLPLSRWHDFSPNAPSNHKSPFNTVNLVDVSVPASPILVYRVPAGNGPDDLTLRRNGTDVEIFDNNTASVVASLAADVTESVVVFGADDEANTLTVDYGFGGFFSLNDGIGFSGGAGGPDSLFVVGDGNTSAVYLPSQTVPGDGAITVTAGADALTITFTGLEPIEASGLPIRALDRV